MLLTLRFSLNTCNVPLDARALKFKPAIIPCFTEKSAHLTVNYRFWNLLTLVKR